MTFAPREKNSIKFSARGGGAIGQRKNSFGLVLTKMKFGRMGYGPLSGLWGHMMIPLRAFGPGRTSDVPHSTVGGMLFIPPKIILA